MSPFFCPREGELRERLERGQWPHASPGELRAHVAACPRCSELASVQEVFQAERAAAAALPRLPSAGAVWWRAQVRRRQAEMERIRRPLLGAQIFALSLALTLAVGALAWQVRRGVHPWAWFGSLHLRAFWSVSVQSFAGSFSLGIPILAMIALVSGVVVYFAADKR